MIKAIPPQHFDRVADIVAESMAKNVKMSWFPPDAWQKCNGDIGYAP